MVGAIVFAVAVAAFSRIPLLPDIGRDLSLGAGEIGLLTTAFGLGRLLTDLPAGRLADAIAPTVGDERGPGSLLALSCGLARRRRLVRRGAGRLGADRLRLGADQHDRDVRVRHRGRQLERRGASMAIYVTALMSGQIVGPALGGTIGDARPTGASRSAVSAAIGVGVAAVCGGLWWRARSGSLAGVAAERAAGAPADAVGADRPSRRELSALALAPFATFFGMAGLTQTLIPLIGDGELGFSASTIGLAIGAGAALRFVGAWVAGVASDRLTRKVVLVPSLVLMAIGGAVLALTSSVATWSASIALVALGSSGISVAAAAVADRVPAPELGRELGLFRLVGDLGLVVGPIVTGFIYQASGPRLAGLATAAVFAAAALAAAAWVREAPRADGRAEDTGEIVLE